MFLCTTLLCYAAEKVLVWDDTQPFPFGSDLTAAQKATATNALRTDGSVPMAGTLVTTNVTISGGSPHEGYFLKATNDAGETTWSRGRTSFKVSTPNAISVNSGGISNLNFTVVVTNDGLPYASGFVNFSTGHWIVGGCVIFIQYSTTSAMQVILNKNGAALAYGDWVGGSAGAVGYYVASSVVVSDYSTGAVYNLAMRAAGATLTNSAHAASVFWAEKQGE